MNHEFIQKFIIQQNYEIHKFLWFFSYRKKVDRVVIPTGLCALCNLLEIQHHD